MLSEQGEQLASALRGHRFLRDQLTEGVATVLHGASDHVQTSVRLGGNTERLDFLCDSRIGVKLCSGGSVQSVLRLCFSYAKTGKVTELLLVTDRMKYERELGSSWTLGGAQHPCPLEVVRIAWL